MILIVLFLFCWGMIFAGPQRFLLLGWSLGSRLRHFLYERFPWGDYPTLLFLLLLTGYAFQLLFGVLWFILYLYVFLAPILLTPKYVPSPLKLLFFLAFLLGVVGGWTIRRIRPQAL